VGWTIYRVAETALALNLQTVSTEADLRAVVAGQREPDGLMAMMTPQQCLDLAEGLRRNAEAVLQQRTPPQSGQN
jgi:hypothetical protein